MKSLSTVNSIITLVDFQKSISNYCSSLELPVTLHHSIQEAADAILNSSSSSAVVAGSLHLVGGFLEHFNVPIE